jgi:hypothetical protein
MRQGTCADPSRRGAVNQASPKPRALREQTADRLSVRCPEAPAICGGGVRGMLEKFAGCSDRIVEVVRKIGKFALS